MIVEKKGNRNQVGRKATESPGLICSCMLEPLKQSIDEKANHTGRQAAIIYRIEADEICFEARVGFKKDHLYKINFSPLGGAPFSVQARVLGACASYRPGFHFTSAKFEELTPHQHQSLLALMASVNAIKARK